MCVYIYLHIHTYLCVCVKLYLELIYIYIIIYPNVLVPYCLPNDPALLVNPQCY